MIETEELIIMFSILYVWVQNLSLNREHIFMFEHFPCLNTCHVQIKTLEINKPLNKHKERRT